MLMMALFTLETRAKASSLHPLAHPLPRSIQYIYMRNFLRNQLFKKIHFWALINRNSRRTCSKRTCILFLYSFDKIVNTFCRYVVTGSLFCYIGTVSSLLETKFSNSFVKIIYRPLIQLIIFIFINIIKVFRRTSPRRSV